MCVIPPKPLATRLVKVDDLCHTHGAWTQQCTEGRCTVWECTMCDPAVDEGLGEAHRRVFGGVLGHDDLGLVVAVVQVTRAVVLC